MLAEQTAMFNSAKETIKSDEKRQKLIGTKPYRETFQTVLDTPEQLKTLKVEQLTDSKRLQGKTMYRYITESQRKNIHMSAFYSQAEKILLENKKVRCNDLTDMRTYNCSFFTSGTLLNYALKGYKAPFSIVAIPYKASFGRVSLDADTGHIGLYIYSDTDLAEVVKSGGGTYETIY